MRTITAVVVVCLAAWATGAADFDATCTEVVDGDTIVVNRGGTLLTVDLEGVDAPELEQPYGEQSRQALADLVLGKAVSITNASEVGDAEMRGRVLVSGLDVRRELLTEGMAWHDTDNNTEEALVIAMFQARTGKQGLWSDPKAKKPAEWRELMAKRQPTPTPKAKSLAEMAGSVELRKDSRGRTVLDATTKRYEERDEGPVKTVGDKGTTYEFHCPPADLEECLATAFSACLADNQPGNKPGVLALNMTDGGEGKTNVRFSGTNEWGTRYLYNATCRCGEEEPDCACALLFPK